MISIKLQTITQHNFEDVVDLEVHDHQLNYLASNVFSIAEASFFPHYVTRAIYAEQADSEQLVGFLMYVTPACDEDSATGVYYIWRFMLDKKYQHQGYGRAALSALIDEIRTNQDARKIMISYAPDNRVAKSFYASFGFSELAIGEDGEMEAVLELKALPN